MNQMRTTNRSISRRQFLKMTGLVGGAGLLAACAPQQKAAGVKEATKAAEAPAAPSTEQVRLSWWNQFSTPTCQEWFPAIVKDFEAKYPNIKIDFEITGGP